MVIKYEKIKNDMVGAGMLLHGPFGELMVDSRNVKRAVKEYRNYYNCKGKHIELVDLDAPENSLINCLKRLEKLNAELEMLKNEDNLAKLLEML